MPLRLIAFVILFLVFFLFIVLNLENKTDIRFGFTTLKDIPVFVTAFFSFIAGMFCTFPFLIRKRKKVEKVKEKGLLAKATKKQGDAPFADKNNYGID